MRKPTDDEQVLLMVAVPLTIIFICVGLQMLGILPIF